MSYGFIDFWSTLFQIPEKAQVSEKYGLFWNNLLTLSIKFKFSNVLVHLNSH